MVTKKEFILAIKGIQEQINDLNEKLNNLIESNNEALELAIIDLAEEIDNVKKEGGE